MRTGLLARVHPLLFAAYPILHMWSANPQEGNSLDVIVLLIASLLAATALVEGLRRMVFGSVEKAAAATTLAALIFFNYGSIYDLLHGTGFAAGRHRYLVPIALLLVGSLWYWVHRRAESDSARPTYFALLGGALVLLAPVRFVLDTSHPSPDAAPLEQAWIDGITRAQQPRPDIYYFVLDGYTRQDQLERVFGFRNADFLEALERRGFAIASRSRSNYGYTLASLASVLNFEHLDQALGLDSDTGFDDRTLRALLRNNRAFRLLGLAGYRRYVIDRRVDFSPSIDPPEVLSDCGSSGEFVEAFLQTTAARVVRSRWGGFTAGKRRRVIRCQFEVLESAVRDPGPKLVYFHSLVTHPPFLFERDGSARAVRDVVARKWRPWLPKEDYVDQIELVNRFLLTVIDDILRRSDDAIIVLQADHGSVTSPEPPSDRSPPEQLEQRFAILNALRIPGAGEGAVTETMTSINSFPLILREQFGLAIPDRRDGSYLRTGRDGAFKEVELRRPSSASR